MTQAAGNRQIVVTGAAGYIGSHAALALLDEGDRVVGIDNFANGNRGAVEALARAGGDRFRFVEADLLDQPRLTAALRESCAETVLHFAALASVPESLREPLRYWWNNTAGTISLVHAMQTTGIRRIVFSSTCATYGIPGPEHLPLTERAPQSPINPYGRSKLAAERVLLDELEVPDGSSPDRGAAARSSHERATGANSSSERGIGERAPGTADPLSVAILRYFNVAGCDAKGRVGEDHRPETHLIPIALDVALGIRPHVDLFGEDYPTTDGTCVRDYVHVSDLIHAHLLAMDRMRPGAALIANVGIGRGFSVREVLDSCRRITGHPIPHRGAPRREGDPPTLFADATKIRRELDWSPKYTALDDTVASAWQWRSRRPHGYSTPRRESAGASPPR